MNKKLYEDYDGKLQSNLYFWAKCTAKLVKRWPLYKQKTWKYIEKIC